MTRLACLIEGHGEESAVPELWRRWQAWRGTYEYHPQPICYRTGKLCSAQDPGKLERACRYLLEREDVTSLIILMDSDRDCPRAEAKWISAEIIRTCSYTLVEKKAAACLPKSEFEAWFLHSLPSISRDFPEFQWNLTNYDPDFNWESIINAKGKIAEFMGRGAYHETRDQVRFSSSIDLAELEIKSPSFRHFDRVLQWIHQPDQYGVYNIT